MAYQDALTLLAYMFQLPDEPTSKASIIAIAQAGDPPIDATAFILGEPTERWIDASASTMAAWGTVPTQALRAMFLRLSTDPGDIADDGVPDQSADQTPRPGMLSVAGASWFGTIREELLYAKGFETVTNNTGASVNIKPYDLTFERNFAGADGGSPTYRNTPDSLIYTNFDGSVTINNGTSKILPIQSDQIGTYASASAASISILVTQTFGALTVTNANAVNGRDREARSDYIKRCFLAPSSNAPGGPLKAYLRAMNTAKGGVPLINYLTGAVVSITSAQILPSNGLGTVTGYLAGPSGAPDPTDVSSANANITGIPLGLITDPIGVLPDTVTILPSTSDPGTGGPGFAGATNTTIAITYSVKIQKSKVSGGAAVGTYTYLSTNVPPTTAPEPIAGIFDLIAQALGSYLPVLGPGGLDQTAGAGVIYTADIGDTIRDASPGLYAPSVSAPSTPTTAIALGHVGAQGVTTGTIVVVAG